MKLASAVTAVVLLAGAAGTLPAQGRGAAAASGPQRWWWAWPSAPDAQSVERGKADFAQSCASCHAQNMAGTSKAPTLMRSSLVRHDADGSAIIGVIQSGTPDKKMPSIQLSAAQMKDIVAFIQWSIQNYDRTSAGAPPQDYPLSNLLVGNADAGKAFFNGAGGCAKCHSPTGDLAGIAGKYAPVDLQARFLMPRTRKPTNATVTLSSGEKVTGQIRLINNFTVTIVDSTGKSQSWPVDTVKVQIEDPLQAHRDLLPKYTDADVHNMFAYLETLK